MVVEQPQDVFPEEEEQEQEVKEVGDQEKVVGEIEEEGG